MFYAFRVGTEMIPIAGIPNVATALADSGTERIPGRVRCAKGANATGQHDGESYGKGYISTRSPHIGLPRPGQVQLRAPWCGLQLVRYRNPARCRSVYRVLAHMPDGGQ